MLETLIENFKILNSPEYDKYYYSFDKFLKKSKVRMIVNLNNPDVVFNCYFPFSFGYDFDKIKYSDFFLVPRVNFVPLILVILGKFFFF